MRLNSKATAAARDADTRARLIAAAGEVFAEHGFRAATVREICARATANVAAVNYHFGDKEALYREVFGSALAASAERYPLDLGLAPAAGPNEQMHGFVHAFLTRLLDDTRPGWVMKLYLRELADPTGVLARVVDRVHRPLFERLSAIVDGVADGRLDAKAVRACCHSIIGQCIFYKHASPVLDALGHRTPATPKEIERVAEHVASFSLAGIRELVRRESKGER